MSHAVRSPRRRTTCLIWQVATQAIMYEEGRGKSLVLDLLYLLNVGSDAGELIGLVFAPQVGSTGT